MIKWMNIEFRKELQQKGDDKYANWYWSDYRK